MRSPLARVTARDSIPTGYFYEDLRADARPPLRPAAFFWAVVPPCEELEPEPDFLPPRLDEPGEFAIRAARCFDMPFFLSFSYCFSFLTLARLPGISCLLRRFPRLLPARERSKRRESSGMSLDAYAEQIRELALSLPESYEDAPWGFPVFKLTGNRMFAWMIVRETEIEVTVKLTREEREIAHLLSYVSIARYVGRYGWISARVTDEETLDNALEWIRESWWLKAPKHLRSAVEE